MIADILIAFLLFLCLFALAGVISILYDVYQELQNIRRILELKNTTVLYPRGGSGEQ